MRPKAFQYLKWPMIAVVVLLALSVVPTLFPKRTAQPPGPGGGTDPVEMREQDMFGNEPRYIVTRRSMRRIG